MRSHPPHYTTHLIMNSNTKKRHRCSQSTHAFIYSGAYKTFLFNLNFFFLLLFYLLFYKFNFYSSIQQTVINKEPIKQLHSLVKPPDKLAFKSHNKKQLSLNNFFFSDDVKRWHETKKKKEKEPLILSIQGNQESTVCVKISLKDWSL